MKERVGSLLVVEDSELNRDLLSRSLRRKGYHVQTAESGTRALELIAKGDFDLVLLNIALSQVNGLEVLGRIRKTHTRWGLPVIMVTGQNDSEQAVSALNLGANDCITTPIDFPVAFARITTHLSLKRTQESLLDSQTRYALAAQGANDGLWDWSLDTNEIYLSLRWKSMLGYEDHEIGNQVDEWFNRVHPDDIDGLRASVREHLEGKSSYFQSEHRIIHRDGNYRWVVSRGLAVRDETGRASRMAGSQRDVTAERIVDPLTGLPSRLLFMDRLGYLLARAKRQREYLFSVLSVDLDHLHVVNDSLGRATTDSLLVALAKRVESCLRSVDTLARFNAGHTVARVGDYKFSVLLDDIKTAANATRVAERLLGEFSVPFNLGGQEIFASAWIGIAFNTPGHTDSEELLRDADTAMNWARVSGKSRYEVFDPSMRNQALVRLQMETELRRAIERQELQNNYQIIVSMKTGQIAGFETLMRWHHPTKGIVAPAEFIPLAEETGLVVDIDQLGLQRACRQLNAWQERYGNWHSWVMCINLSARQFRTLDVVDRVVQTLNDTGMDPRSLKLEVTESLMMQNMEIARTALRRIKELGTRVALDDFGTGYSSLSYLDEFPVDTLKIDRTFIARLGKQGENSAIVAAIISLAHSLGLDVVAEGVETEDQLRLLEKLGCEYAQGYYFARPMPASALEGFLTALRRDRESGIPALLGGEPLAALMVPAMHFGREEEENVIVGSTQGQP